MRHTLITTLTTALASLLACAAAPVPVPTPAPDPAPAPDPDSDSNSLDFLAYTIPRCVASPGRADDCGDTLAYRGTLAAGLCADTPTVYLLEASYGHGYEGPTEWTIDCGQGRYDCHLYSDKTEHRVSCSSIPVCGNDVLDIRSATLPVNPEGD